MLWIKTFHIFGVMSWLSGLFYLPTLLVHYAEALTQGEDVRRLKTMARRLLRLTTMMAIVALSLGVWLWLGFGIGGVWLHVKLFLVLVLVALHLTCWRYVEAMDGGGAPLSSRALRIFSVAAMLAVVPLLIMVVVKPF